MLHSFGQLFNITVSVFVNVYLKQETTEPPQIGEIFETESKSETVGDDGDNASKSQKVASLYQLGDNVVHCHVQQRLHQEWLNEFCETVSISQSNLRYSTTLVYNFDNKAPIIT